MERGKVAHRWYDVLQAIRNKDTDPQQYNRFFIGSITNNTRNVYRAAKKKPNQKKPYRTKDNLQFYFLGKPFFDTYLTRREAECMALMIRGYTNPRVAAKLKLSVRTVEFYIKNMRQKLNCHSKSHLIETVRRSDFVKVINSILRSLT